MVSFLLFLQDKSGGREKGAGEKEGAQVVMCSQSFISIVGTDGSSTYVFIIIPHGLSSIENIEWKKLLSEHWAIDYHDQDREIGRERGVG